MIPVTVALQVRKLCIKLLILAGGSYKYIDINIMTVNASSKKEI